MKDVSLLEMLQNGLHFGHQVSRWHPKMGGYIFGVRNGVHIINLEKTQEALLKSCEFVANIAASGGTVLFVGSKRQCQDIIRDAALSCGMPYVNKRWLGGLMTNFNVLFKVLKKYKDLKYKMEVGKLSKYTKKEQLEFSREIERLEESVGGIANLEKIPDAVFLVDVKREKTAFAEAQTKGVPVVAICDTNVNPEEIDYPIPANDDATKSITFIVGLIAEAVKEGKARPKPVIIKKEDVKAVSFEASAKKEEGKK